MAGFPRRGEVGVQKIDRYFALCTDEEGKREVAPLLLRIDEELGNIMGMSVYTALDGDAQREDLTKWAGETTISPVSREDLLDAMDRIYPSSVFVDGAKLAGSVFRGILKTELGLPIKHPRPINLDAAKEDPTEGLSE